MALTEKRIACIQHIKDCPASESVGREKLALRKEMKTKNASRL